MKTWWKYARPYLAYFVLCPVFMTAEIFGEAMLPKCLAIVIDGASSHGPMWCVGVMAGMTLLSLLVMAGGAGAAWFGVRASAGFSRDLRNDVYGKVMGFSFRNIDQFSTGSLITRLTNDITQIQNFVSTLLRVALRAPGMLILSLLMALSIRPSLSLVFVAVTPFLAITVWAVIKVGLGRFRKMQHALDTLNTKVEENLINQRVVKSFVMEEHEKKAFGKADKDLKDSGMRAMTLMVLLSPLMTLFMNVTTAIVLWFGGRMVVGETDPLMIGELSAFITYCSQILMALMMMAMVLMLASRAMASAERVKEILGTEPDIKDGEGTDENLEIKNGDVEFRGVTFRYYGGSEKPVLEDIDLSVPAGSTLGIIGSTGSGKSTLVSLLPRFYDPDSGSVLIDGHDVRDYPLENLRKGIGMVLQKDTLFKGSIKENLLWGDPSAADDEVKGAAASAEAEGFVMEKPDGFGSMVEEGGSNLSGGQKQRLGIARALLKKPKILIMDDSTSAVDTATERRIRKALSSALPGTTKIIISQRVISVESADMIAVMDEGRIVASGTHDELLESSPEYREIWQSQNTKEAL